MSERAEAVRTSARRARANRPCRPITLPMSSGATWSRKHDRVIPLDSLDTYLVGLVDELTGDPGDELLHGFTRSGQDARMSRSSRRRRQERS